MPTQGIDEIITQFKHKRAYIQYGGARPSNGLRYSGQDAQYISITGVSAPESGGVDPVWVPDPNRLNQWRLVGKMLSTADMPAADVVFREKHGAISRALLRSCPFNLYELTGTCGDLQNFLTGWNDYVLVYSGAVVTDKDLGDRVTFDSDDPIEDTLSVTLDEVYPVGPMNFGTVFSSLSALVTVDIVFYAKNECSNCGFDDQNIYALIASDGVNAAKIIYSTDMGEFWNSATIAGIGTTETVYAIDRVSNYLVVVGADAYYYALVDKFTGAPGAFTKITTGFVANKSPRDIYVDNPREVYLVGLGGYVYKSIDITAGVKVVSDGSGTSSDLLRVHGADGVIVATGANGAVLKSSNRGSTWTTTQANPENLASIQAVCVLGRERYWIGTSTGRVYSTQDSGETWQQLSNPALAGAIKDILFATQEVGHILFYNGSTSQFLTTWNGGANWSSGANRVQSFPVLTSVANRLAVPETNDPGVIANMVLIAV